MQTSRLNVDEDGHVAIPDTRPGQTVTVRVETTPEAGHGPIPEEEREAIKERVRQSARVIRERLPEPWRSSDHGDLLYGEDGLPK